MGTDDHCHKLRSWRKSEQRHIEYRAIGLLIKRTLQQCIGDHYTSSSPGLWVRGHERANTATNWTLLAKPFLRETGVNNSDRLFPIVVLTVEIATFKNLQSHRAEVAV